MNQSESSQSQPDATQTSRLEPGVELADARRPASLSPDEAAAIREKALEILRQEPPAPPPIPAAPENRVTLPATSPSPIISAAADPIPPIPARMLNEFVYCPRLFYYEHVEGIFVENADTARGTAIHQRVDTGKGELPPATPRTTSNATAPPADGGAEAAIIHSRSVSLGSESLGVTAKLDLVEIRQSPADSAGGVTQDLFAPVEVCPVDYKAGAPRRGDEANELWDTDRMQLGLQMLLLRDNGYVCREGIIYYRATKQRVRLPMTPELGTWVIGRIAEARQTMRGPIPAPLISSPKCVRCSLAPVCLPDETRMLASHSQPPGSDRLPPADAANQQEPGRTGSPRRLIAARDDRRALYLNTPGLRVGISDGVMQVREKDKLLDEVRLNDVCHVALFGNIQLSTQAIQALCEAETPITYFSMGGWFYGLTRGHELKDVFLRIEQFRLARDADTCLWLARQFVHGKIRNHRTMLMRNHVEPPAPALARLKNAAETALQARTLEELLGMEGAAASLYFEHFGGMLKFDDAASGDAPVTGQLAFNFSHRNRRPPTDPVNALLSLAYSVLAKDCTIAAMAVGFDPYIGFVTIQVQRRRAAC